MLKRFIFVILTSIVSTTHAQAACVAKHSQRSLQTIDVRKVNQSLFSAALLAETNAYRCQKGLSKVKLDRSLNSAAKMQSTNMARLNKMSHNLPIKTEQTAKIRFKKAKVKMRGIGAENLALLFKFDVDNGPFGITNSSLCQFTHSKTKQPLQEYTYLRLAKRMVANWSTSPEHNKIMLLKKAGRMGGAATFIKGGTLCGRFYISQTFAGK